MAGTRRECHQAPQRLILDSGAVIALARGDQRARAFLARPWSSGYPSRSRWSSWPRRSAAACDYELPGLLNPKFSASPTEIDTAWNAERRK